MENPCPCPQRGLESCKWCQYGLKSLKTPVSFYGEASHKAPFCAKFVPLSDLYKDKYHRPNGRHKNIDL